MVGLRERAPVVARDGKLNGDGSVKDEKTAGTMTNVGGGIGQITNVPTHVAVARRWTVTGVVTVQND